MKVLHVYKTYLPDSFNGVERVIWEIAQNTGQMGVEAEVLSVSSDPDPVDVQIGNHVSSRVRENLFVASTSISISMFGELRRRAVSADIIHYHFPWPMMDLAHFVCSVQKPSVVTYHSDVVRQRTLLLFYRPLMMRFLRSVDRIVATSPNYLTSSPVLARLHEKSNVIPIGISDQPPVEQALVQQLRLRVGERFFLFVGALRYYKGLRTLLKAAAFTGLPVVIVGKGDGEADIREANLANVRYLGEVNDDEKLALLQLCGTFVFPSHLRSEAFGVALLEAARAGRPMISCEIGTGTSYINIAEETGLVVTPNDPGALADAMRALWAGHELRERMGRAARSRYERVFTSAAMARSYVELYSELLGERRSSNSADPKATRDSDEESEL